MPKFEECLDRLEKILAELERGEVPLEQSLKLFEEGIRLSDSCRKELEEAEGKVLIRGTYLLSRSSGVNRIKGGSVQIN